jgi:hypothetical protein
MNICVVDCQSFAAFVLGIVDVWVEVDRRHQRRDIDESVEKTRWLRDYGEHNEFLHMREGLFIVDNEGSGGIAEQHRWAAAQFSRGG